MDVGKREDTRAFIIEKTAPLLNKRGYIGMSMRDITDSTGLTKGSIYGNFQDKEEVALQAFKYSLRLRKKSILESLRKAGQSPLARLKAYPAFFIKNHNDIMSFGGCPLVNMSMDADDLNTGLDLTAKEYIESWRRALIKLFKDAIAAGEIRSDLNASREASVMISMLEGGLWMTRATGQKKDLEYAMQNVAHLLDAMAA